MSVNPRRRAAAKQSRSISSISGRTRSKCFTGVADHVRWHQPHRLDGRGNSNWSAAGDDGLILDPGAAAPGGRGSVLAYTAAKSEAGTVIPTVGHRGKCRYARSRPVFGVTHATVLLSGIRHVENGTAAQSRNGDRAIRRNDQEHLGATHQASARRRLKTCLRYRKPTERYVARFRHRHHDRSR